MLKSLQLEGFRNLLSTGLELYRGITVFGGPNGAGEPVLRLIGRSGTEPLALVHDRVRLLADFEEQMLTGRYLSPAILARLRRLCLSALPARRCPRTAFRLATG